MVSRSVVRVRVCCLLALWVCAGSRAARNVVGMCRAEALRARMWSLWERWLPGKLMERLLLDILQQMLVLGGEVEFAGRGCCWSLR